MSGAPIPRGEKGYRGKEAMTELPELPERLRRLHLLRWNDLIDKRRFTGEHLRWHESRDQRRQAAKPKYSLLPPPTSLRGGSVTFYGPNGEPVPYETWHRNQMAAWAARESDSEVIDSRASVETIALATTRFEGIAGCACGV
jgi:hypothetical protein